MTTLNDVKNEAPIEIWPYINYGGYAEPVKGLEPIILDSKFQGPAFIEFIRENNQRHLIEDSLQGMAVRDDGTELLTAFEPYEV